MDIDEPEAEDFEGAAATCSDVYLHMCKRCDNGYPLASWIAMTDANCELVKMNDPALQRALADGRWSNLGEKNVEYVATCVHCYLAKHPERRDEFMQQGSNKVTSKWQKVARHSKPGRVLQKTRAAHILWRCERLRV